MTTDCPQAEYEKLCRLIDVAYASRGKTQYLMLQAQLNRDTSRQSQLAVTLTDWGQEIAELEREIREAMKKLPETS